MRMRQTFSIKYIISPGKANILTGRLMVGKILIVIIFHFNDIGVASKTFPCDKVLCGLGLQRKEMKVYIFWECEWKYSRYLLLRCM